MKGGLDKYFYVPQHYVVGVETFANAGSAYSWAKLNHNPQCTESAFAARLGRGVSTWAALCAPNNNKERPSISKKRQEMAEFLAAYDARKAAMVSHD